MYPSPTCLSFTGNTVHIFHPHPSNFRAPPPSFVYSPCESVLVPEAPFCRRRPPSMLPSLATYLCNFGVSVFFFATRKYGFDPHLHFKSSLPLFHLFRYSAGQRFINGPDSFLRLFPPFNPLFPSSLCISIPCRKYREPERRYTSKG